MSIKNSHSSTHIKSFIQALFVTFLWSTSWIIVKFALPDIPALTFAGLRYFLAFLCLLPFAIKQTPSSQWKQLNKKEWIRLLLLGIFYYSITQGAQFLALSHLPAVTASLILNFSTATVTLLGIFFLSEKPTKPQSIGIIINLIGILIYFYPLNISNQHILGITFATIAMIANAVSSIIGRAVNRTAKFSPLVVTTISMGIGSILLLLTGILTQGLPALSISNWLSILWLAIINTAFAFTLWNFSLQTLSAAESSLINSTMFIQIAFLAWIFLGESISKQELLGMLFATIGILIVQSRKANKNNKN